MAEWVASPHLDPTLVNSRPFPIPAMAAGSVDNPGFGPKYLAGFQHMLARRADQHFGSPSGANNSNDVSRVRGWIRVIPCLRKRLIIFAQEGCIQDEPSVGRMSDRAMKYVGMTLQDETVGDLR